MGQSPATPTATSARPATPPVSSVAERVQAFYQGARDIGWDSQAQHDRWWLSACAPAALTEVLRAWGAKVGIGPVLDTLIADQAITVQGGLLDANALAAVARQYGNQAVTFWRWSVELLAQVTAQGVPVLVNVVDAHRRWYPAFDVGHWLVVTCQPSRSRYAIPAATISTRSLQRCFARSLLGLEWWSGGERSPCPSARKTVRAPDYLSTGARQVPPRR